MYFSLSLLLSLVKIVNSFTFFYFFVFSSHRITPRREATESPRDFIAIVCAGVRRSTFFVEGKKFFLSMKMGNIFLCSRSGGRERERSFEKLSNYLECTSPIRLKSTEINTFCINLDFSDTLFAPANPSKRFFTNKNFLPPSMSIKCLAAKEKIFIWRSQTFSIFATKSHKFLT